MESNVLVPAVIRIHLLLVYYAFIRIFIHTETARTLVRSYARSVRSERTIAAFLYFIIPSISINTSIQRKRLQYWVNSETQLRSLGARARFYLPNYNY